MKICFLTHNLQPDGGAGVFAFHLIEGLRDFLKCEVIVLTTLGSGQPDEKPILYTQKSRLIWQIPQIRKIIKECDVVHAFDMFPYGLLTVLASWGLRKKIIITVIGSGSIIPLYQKAYSFFVKYCYRKADRLTAISHFTKEEILKKMPKLNIAVINPGIDLENFTSCSKKRLDLFKYYPYILSVGALRWRKGYHFSIQAFAKVSQRFPDLKYVIVGKKHKLDYYERLQKLIQDLNLENRVFLLDNVDNRQKLYQIYQGAELFCLLSQNKGHDVEGFGIVFLEAAVNGLPEVGSMDCGVEDATRDGKNGFLVNSRDINEFAQAIIKILQDKDLKEKMGAESLTLARLSSWDSKIEAYSKIYKELLKR